MPAPRARRERRDGPRRRSCPAAPATAARAAAGSASRCTAPIPSGPRLTVRFRVYPRTDRARPAGEPIVAAEGGPGYGSIDSGAGYRFLLGPLRRDHDLILVDNRGTGRSGAIDCPRLQAGKGGYTRNVGRCARQLGPRPTPTAPAPPPTTSPRSSTASASPS